MLKLKIVMNNVNVKIQKIHNSAVKNITLSDKNNDKDCYLVFFVGK